MLAMPWEAMPWDAGLAILGVYRILRARKGAPPRGDPRHRDSRRMRVDGATIFVPAAFDPSEVPQLSAQLLENLSLVGHTAPTALQSYIVPLALAGRDALVVGAGREAQATALLLPVVARLLALDPRAAGPGRTGTWLPAWSWRRPSTRPTHTASHCTS